MDCTFCGNQISKGTGVMFVKRDGTTYYFCSKKCEKNGLKLKRSNRDVRWTKIYRKVRGKEK